MSCARALDGVYDGERCILLETWHGCGFLESISPHVRFRTCAVMLSLSGVFTRVERHVSVSTLVRWHHTCGKRRC